MLDRQGIVSLLEKLLRRLGLADEAVDDLLARLAGWLDEDAPAAAAEKGPPAGYQLRDDFLSPAEHSFYLVLRQAVADWAIVCPKVGLADLFFTSGGDRRANWVAWNRINRKHVDFLLLDLNNARPLIGVELDDRSHQREDRQRRDQLVDGVFAQAGLPLAHVGLRSTYNTVVLADGLRQRAGLTGDRPVAPPAAVAADAPGEPAAPLCPECGAPMLLRQAKRGPNAGGSFWGCSEYPECRGTRAYESG